MNATNISTKLMLIMATIVLGVCATAGKPVMAKSEQSELVDSSRAALEKLYAVSPEAKQLRDRSQAILVFPEILKAGFLLGGSGGKGVLFSPKGQVLGYYSVGSVSFGLQAGAQTFSEAMFLTTRESLEYVKSTDGWSIGAGPSVVVMDKGAAEDFSSTTLRSDVFAFVYGQEGIMGGIGVQGQKITKLDGMQ